MPDRDPRYLPPVLPPLADLSDLYAIGGEPLARPNLGLADIKDLPDLLRLWQLCGRARCRHRRRCSGDTFACFAAKELSIPPHVLGWFAKVPQACTEGEDFATAVEDAEPFTFAAIAWCAALEAVEECEQKRNRHRDAKPAAGGDGGRAR